MPVRHSSKDVREAEGDERHRCNICVAVFNSLLPDADALLPD